MLLTWLCTLVYVGVWIIKLNFLAIYSSYSVCYKKVKIYFEAFKTKVFYNKSLKRHSSVIYL